MNKKIFFSLLIFSLLLLSSCQMGPRVNNVQQTTNYFKGTSGLEVKFLDQAPPDELFETSDFDVQLYLKNTGAFSLMDPYVAKITLTYDNSRVISLNDYAQGDDLFLSIFPSIKELTPKSKLVFVEGKSANWPDGETDQISLERFKAKEIEGKFQTSISTFVAQICYPYETNFADELCIDTDTEGNSQRQEVCDKEDKTYSSGQGAPIEVVSVRSQMIPRGVYVQPQFTIELEHNNDGTISYRDIAKKSYDPIQCQEIKREDINKISIQVFLGDDELNCLPKDVIFKGGKVKIQCQLMQDKILGVSSNYRTSLVVKAAYIYSESFRKDVVIQKSEGTIFEDSQTGTEQNCFDWESYDSTTKKCVSLCEFKAKNDKSFPGFTSLKKSMTLVKAPEIDDDFLWDHVSCIYSDPAICREKDGLCLFTNGLCPPGTFCGLPSCVLKNTPPQIADLVKVGLDTLSFFCVDSDDELNLKRTCGCINTAFYGFVDRSSDCKNLSIYTESQVGIESFSGIRHSIPDLDQEEYKNMYLCIMVKDKFDKKTIRSLKYPFRLS